MHWTYRAISEKDLLQGDILERTDALDSILRECHAYFCREQYTGFVVLTQSCDLVVRYGEGCKAQHISIAVIRELAPLLPEILAPIAGAGVENVYVHESRHRARDVLRKIINQNDQAGGLFYLHPVTTEVPSLRVLATPSVAMLRVSISLRRQHYDVLCDARRYSLDTEYANKLGWLSGNLFSRVATRDWEDQEQDQNASAAQCDTLLQSVTEKDNQNWVSRSWLKAAEEKDVDLRNINPRAMRSSIETYKPPTPREAAAKVVSAEAEKIITNVGLQKIQSALQENRDFIQEMANNLASLVRDSLEEEEYEQLRIAFDDVRHGEGMARYVVRTLLVDFNKRDSPAEDLHSFLASQRISAETIKIIGVMLIPTVNDAERAATIGKATEGRLLFSPEAISIVDQIVRPWIPILGSASTLAEKIGNRVKNSGAFKDAFRLGSQETQDTGG